MEANSRREVHRHGWRQLFAEFDAVVCPITPTPAFPHDHNPNPLERRIDIDGVEYPYFGLRLAELLEQKIGGFQAPK